MQRAIAQNTKCTHFVIIPLWNRPKSVNTLNFKNQLCWLRTLFTSWSGTPPSFWTPY